MHGGLSSCPGSTVEFSLGTYVAFVLWHDRFGVVFIGSAQLSSVPQQNVVLDMLPSLGICVLGGSVADCRLLAPRE
jgi:hypothetical protein